MMFLAIMIGVPIVLALWIAILLKWQRGLTMLLMYLPFASGIALILRPNPFGAVLKDFLFVLPLYAVFVLLNLRELRHSRIPAPLTLMIVAFSALVILQTFNPSVRDLVGAVIGIKVWLLYIPLAWLVSAMILRAEDLVTLLRVTTVVALIPCGLGIFQFALATAWGYEQTMIAFYGSKAVHATQNFTEFDMGARFFRIPSTFSFGALYAGYTLTMLATVYMHQSIEPNPGWRLFAKIMMGVVFIAAILTGARSNFLFAPMLLLTTLFLDAKLTRIAIWLIFGPLIMITTLQTVGLDIFSVADKTGGLVSEYGSDLVLPQIISSLVNAPLGLGVGTNTGAARVLMSPADAAILPEMLEGYYAKTIFELGIPGLLLLLMILVLIIAYGLGIHRRTRDPMARSCSAAILGFIIMIAVHSFKGWQIDLDPVNVWYWVLIGIMFRLPDLKFDALAETRRRAELEKQLQRTRRPQRRRTRAPGATR